MDEKIGAFLHQCVDLSLEDERQRRWSEVYDALDIAQSPIERRLLCAMAFMETPLLCTPADREARPFILIDGKCSFDLSKWEQWVSIEMQSPVLGYRADFLVSAKFMGRSDISRIVVECDGHDFHERTKEQASRDKRRDREMTSAGFLVLRFTGSDIHRDAIGCAHEVSKLLRKLEWDARPE